MGGDWDAIVVGASFGGLAAAMELAGAGRVLLIDRQPVGAGGTSACGTLLRVLEGLDALDALQQSHEEIVLHLADDKIYRFRPAYPSPPSITAGCARSWHALMPRSCGPRWLYRTRVAGCRHRQDVPRGPAGEPDER